MLVATAAFLAFFLWPCFGDFAMYNWEGDASEVGPRILPWAGEECGEIGYGPLYSPLRAGLFTPDQEIACLRVGSPSFKKYFLVPLPTRRGRADQQGTKGGRLQVIQLYTSTFPFPCLFLFRF